jgi:hypothetical protein
LVPGAAVASGDAVGMGVAAGIDAGEVVGAGEAVGVRAAAAPVDAFPALGAPDGKAAAWAALAPSMRDASKPSPITTRR